MQKSIVSKRTIYIDRRKNEIGKIVHYAKEQNTLEFEIGKKCVRKKFNTILKCSAIAFQRALKVVVKRKREHFAN